VLAIQDITPRGARANCLAARFRSHRGEAPESVGRQDVCVALKVFSKESIAPLSSQELNSCHRMNREATLRRGHPSQAIVRPRWNNGPRIKRRILLAIFGHESSRPGIHVEFWRHIGRKRSNGLDPGATSYPLRHKRDQELIRDRVPFRPEHISKSREPTRGFFMRLLSQSPQQHATRQMRIKASMRLIRS
jgi:hypothetical protein